MEVTVVDHWNKKNEKVCTLYKFPSVSFFSNCYQNKSNLLPVNCLKRNFVSISNQKKNPGSILCHLALGEILYETLLTTIQSLTWKVTKCMINIFRLYSSKYGNPIGTFPSFMISSFGILRNSMQYNNSRFIGVHMTWCSYLFIYVF